jgi:hypothetical protein
MDRTVEGEGGEREGGRRAGMKKQKRSIIAYNITTYLHRIVVLRVDIDPSKKVCNTCVCHINDGI